MLKFEEQKYHAPVYSDHCKELGNYILLFESRKNNTNLFNTSKVTTERKKIQIKRDHSDQSMSFSKLNDSSLMGLIRESPVSLKYKLASKKEGLRTISSTRSVSRKTHRRSDTETKSLAQSRVGSSYSRKRSNIRAFEDIQSRALNSLLHSIEQTY